MDDVLETLVVPRASALPSAASLAPIAAPLRSMVLVSEFRGLKIQSNRSSTSPNFTSKPVGRGGRVVCEAQDTAVVEYIAEVSDDFIKERGAFAIALSGGSLITSMGKLCECPYNKTVDWEKWYIFWADERVVAKSHADSNYKLAKDCLFSKLALFTKW